LTYHLPAFDLRELHLQFFNVGSGPGVVPGSPMVFRRVTSGWCVPGCRKHFWSHPRRTSSPQDRRRHWAS